MYDWRLESIPVTIFASMFSETCRMVGPRVSLRTAGSLQAITGHLDHYDGIPCHHNLLVSDPVNDIHHFAWLNQRRLRLKKGSDAYFIYPSNYYGPPKVSLKNEFDRVEDSVSIPQFRSGNPVRYFVVYRMHDFKGDSLESVVPGIH